MQLKTGFTLIELLIALAIIGILAGIAYPAYRHHIVKAHRTHAAVLLLDLAAQLEQYYNENHSYEDAELAIHIAQEKFYHFEIETKENSYLIKAIPIESQAEADNECATLILDQLGNKAITGTGNYLSCWP